jgi:molecular chaperone HtpG
MRGIIDTPDVDLNVSREMLQQNPAVTKINKAVVKRALGELKRGWKNGAMNMPLSGMVLAR